MKTKTLAGILLTLLGLGAGAFAQDGGGGIGVGVGIGVGAGTGIGANIDVERVPGNVVQGRRVFAAKLVAGSVSTTNHLISPSGGGSPLGVAGIPRGWGSGFSQTVSVQTREFSTVVSLFNPCTNSVTVNIRNTGAAVVAAGPLTLPPLSSQHLTASGPSPLPLGAPAVGFMVIESQAPLEVVALYQYRDERLDFTDETWIETASGVLFGPGF